MGRQGSGTWLYAAGTTLKLVTQPLDVFEGRSRVAFGRTTLIGAGHHRASAVAEHQRRLLVARVAQDHRDLIWDRERHRRGVVCHSGLGLGIRLGTTAKGGFERHRLHADRDLIDDRIGAQLDVVHGNAIARTSA